MTISRPPLISSGPPYHCVGRPCCHPILQAGGHLTRRWWNLLPSCEAPGRSHTHARVKRGTDPVTFARLSILVTWSHCQIGQWLPKSSKAPRGSRREG